MHKSIIVHTFYVTEWEEIVADISAGSIMYEWEQTPKGQWVLSNSTNPPVWTRSLSVNQLAYRYVITATFEPKILTEYFLRFA